MSRNQIQTPTVGPDANAECGGAIGELLSKYRSSSEDTLRCSGFRSLIFFVSSSSLLLSSLLYCFQAYYSQFFVIALKPPFLRYCSQAHEPYSNERSMQQIYACGPTLVLGGAWGTTPPSASLRRNQIQKPTVSVCLWPYSGQRGGLGDNTTVCVTSKSGPNMSPCPTTWCVVGVESLKFGVRGLEFGV